MCWPLSSMRRRPACSCGMLRARPPARRAASNTVTWWPEPVARTAAARPAQPAPTMASFIADRPARAARSQPTQGVDVPGEPELAQRREADALVQHGEVVALDLAQQRAVDAGHHEAGLLRAQVGGRQQRQRLF